MKKVVEYDAMILVRVAQDMLQAENELNLFLLEIPKRCWLPSLSVEKRIRYEDLTERDSAEGSRFQTACLLVNADPSVVVALAKAINRYEKHGGKYDRCVWSFSHKTDRHIRRSVALDVESQYYNTTGRRKAC